MKAAARVDEVKPFRMETYPGRQTPLLLDCLVGDLLAQEVEAIVCPCNSDLTHVAPLPRRIADAAGPTWEGEAAALRVRFGTLGVGTARLQNEAGRLLHAECVIHAVGPLWGTPAEDADEHHVGYVRTLLADTVFDALRCAHRAGVKSLALPPIAAERLPGGIVATAHLQGIRRFARSILHSSLTQVRLVVTEGILVPLLKAVPLET